jgi:hypothetical protein
LLPTLDIGSHSNAGRQLLPEAGAERTLEAVSCTPMLGGDCHLGHELVNGFLHLLLQDEVVWMFENQAHKNGIRISFCVLLPQRHEATRHPMLHLIHPA